MNVEENRCAAGKQCSHGNSLFLFLEATFMLCNFIKEDSLDVCALVGSSASQWTDGFEIVELNCDNRMK